MTVIRRASVDDFAGLSHVLEGVDALHWSSLPSIFQPLADGELLRPAEYISELLADPLNLILVAEDEGRITGAVVAMVKSAPPLPVFIPRKFIVIDVIGVLPECRGQGVGKALMEKVTEWAHEQDITQIELVVYDFNQSAIHFYESLGFTTFNRRMNLNIS